MNSNDSLFNNRQNMPISSHVRFLNAVVGLPPVDLYADGDLIAQNISHGEFTAYDSVPPGIYNIELFRTGETENPVEQNTESFTVGSSFTLAAIGTANDVNLYQIPEPYSSPVQGLYSYIRLVNLAQTAPPLSATLQNGTQIFDNVRFTELTNYYRLIPNIYNIEITSGDSGDVLLNVPNLRLQAGKVYTIYILDSEDSKLPYQALFVADSEYQPPHENT